MVYRNFSRLILAVVASALGIAAIIVGLTLVAFRHDREGFTVPVSPVAAAILALLVIAFLITATGWLVLRGVNYDTWYRSTYGGRPLHHERTDD